MEIVYVSTHAIMAICLIAVVFLSIPRVNRKSRLKRPYIAEIPVNHKMPQPNNTRLYNIRGEYTATFAE